MALGSWPKATIKRERERERERERYSARKRSGGRGRSWVGEFFRRKKSVSHGFCTLLLRAASSPRSEKRPNCKIRNA